MTNCAKPARGPDEQRLVDVTSILAAGIVRLRERQSLPEAKRAKNPGNSSFDRRELPGETVLIAVHGAQSAARSIPQNHQETHMHVNVGIEVAAMQELPVAQFRNRHAEMFGETTNARNKQWLLKVLVLDEGFEYAGEKFQSRSGVA